MPGWSYLRAPSYGLTAAEQAEIDADPNADEDEDMEDELDESPHAHVRYAPPAEDAADCGWLPAQGGNTPPKSPVDALARDHQSLRSRSREQRRRGDAFASRTVLKRVRRGLRAFPTAVCSTTSAVLPSTPPPPFPATPWRATPPRAGSTRAMSDEPSAEPVAQARADATPKSKARAPSAEPHASPSGQVCPSQQVPRFDFANMGFRGPERTGTHNPATAAFPRRDPKPAAATRPRALSTLTLPPPPPRPSEVGGRVPPSPLPPVPEHPESPVLGIRISPTVVISPTVSTPPPDRHDTLPDRRDTQPDRRDSLLSPVATPPSTVTTLPPTVMTPPTRAIPDSDADAAGKDFGGRPSKVQAASMAGFVQEGRSLAEKYSQENGLPAERYLAAVAFARSRRHAAAEYQRIAPDFDPHTMKLPRFTATDLSCMYRKFQEAYPDGEAETILGKYQEVAQGEQEDTLATFGVGAYPSSLSHTFLLILPQIDAATEKGFEDSELALVISSPGLADFATYLKHGASGEPLTCSDLLGIAKICAYTSQLTALMEPGVIIPDALLDALGNSSPAKLSATTSAKAAKAAKVAKGVSPTTVDPSSIVVARRAPSPGSASRIVATTPNINAMRDRFCSMSQECLVLDLFRDKGGRVGNFLWVPLGATLAANDLRLVGYPANVRLPGEIVSDKASGAWRSQDLTYFNVALLEHELGRAGATGWSGTSDLVIVGHNYEDDAPDEPAAAALHWKTSCGREVRCQDALGNIWAACVDLRRAGDAAITKRLIAERQVKAPAKGKAKAKAKESDGEEDEEEEQEPAAKPAAKPAPKPAPKPAAKVPKVGKTAASKQKTPLDESSDENQAHPGEEASLGGGSRPVPAVTKFFDFDDHDHDAEEEEETTLPPAKKTRSAGASDTSRHPLATQEGGGRSSKSSSMSPSPPATPTTPLSWLNGAGAMGAIPSPESQAGPSGHASGGHGGRNVIPAGHESHVAGPSAASTPATPAELATFLGRLAHASSDELAVLMSSIKFPSPP
ncbi:hypothetical protein B0H14DRAFT_3520155 [Mycena olivaceomarginata]|nr:hypothetical protein B0H14DRAFT_3520155 [Mycena olivaceomarginata]